MVFFLIVAAGLLMGMQGWQPAPAPDLTALHSHICPTCRIQWSHDGTNKGNEAAHTCPGCGKVVWS
jgi:hypothetical protein